MAKINGWAPDAKKPLFGLPGAIAPFGFFDPLGFAKDASLNDAKVRETLPHRSFVHH